LYYKLPRGPLSRLKYRGSDQDCASRERRCGVRPRRALYRLTTRALRRRAHRCGRGPRSAESTGWRTPTT